MSRRRKSSLSKRQRIFEQLERRDLLAAEPFGQNPLQPLDVTRDGLVTSLDALRVINALGRTDGDTADPTDSVGSFIDVNGDQRGSALDALRVINALDRSIPVIAATLPNDSGPMDRVDLGFDLITNDYALNLHLSFAEVGSRRVEMRIGSESDFVDITDQFANDRAELSLSEIDTVNGNPLDDGEQPITVRVDEDGSRIEFVLTVDRQSPELLLDRGDLLRRTTDRLVATFNETIVAETVPLDVAQLREVGVGPLEIQGAGVEGSSVVLPLERVLPDGEFVLEIGGGVKDLAGNDSQDQSLSFRVADPTGIASISPADGERQVNVTRETIITFDEPIDPSTVTMESIRVSAAGLQVPGRIRVNRTGQTATYFYEDPLPASTSVRVAIDGALIRGVDGFLLDADGDDQPGGERQDEFRTLPLTLIPGTELFGTVRDSQTRQPIAGATLTLEAFPSITATTNEEGFFELGVQDLNSDGVSDGLPAPDFFVFIDGASATPPGGGAYAYLGKPLHSVAGERTELNMAGQPFDIFLPPIPTDAAVPIVPGEATQFNFGSASIDDLIEMMPGVDPQLFEQMRVEIPPDAALNDQGNLASSAFVIPVDPDFLPAPLPPNLDPELVVSIQAPGTTNFDVPAPVTFPNLEGLPPGASMLLFSFNHDAGRFEVNGTATVSEDGMAVRSDPGVGIEAPGWHFVDPVTCNGSGGPPAPPPSMPGEITETHEVLSTIFGESGNFATLEFVAPGDTPTPDDSCPAPHPQDEGSLDVKITVDGPLGDFMKPGSDSDFGVTSTSFRLAGGSGATKTFSLDAKSFVEMFGGPNPFRSIDANRLYGSTITVTRTMTPPEGASTGTRVFYHLTRFIDATDADHTDRRMEFEDSLSGSVTRTKPLEVLAGSMPPRLTTTAPFAVNGSGAATMIAFTPTDERQNQSGELTIRGPAAAGEATAGTVRLRGDGESVQEFTVDQSSLLNPDDFLDALENAFDSDMTASEQAIFGTTVGGTLQFDEALAMAFIADVITEANAVLAPLGVGISQVASTSSRSVDFNDFEADPIIDGSGLGLASSLDVNATQLSEILTGATTLSGAERRFRLSEAVNENYDGNVDVYVDQYFAQISTAFTRQQLVRSLGKTIAHELGHEIGLPHTRQFSLAGTPLDTTDVMAQGLVLGAQKAFSTTLPAGLVALGLSWTEAQGDAAIDYYRRARAYGSVGDQVEGGGDEGIHLELPPLNAGLLWIGEASQDVLVNTISFDAVVQGTDSGMVDLFFENGGDSALTIEAITLEGFELEPLLSGVQAPVAIEPFDRVQVTLTLPSDVAGQANGQLVVQTDGLLGGAVLDVRGRVIPADATLRINATNNFGGVSLDQTVSNTSLLTLVNEGAAPLTISEIMPPESNAFVLQLPTLPVTLATGESVSISGSFTPEALGLNVGGLVIRSDAANASEGRTAGTFSATVIGTGLGERLDVAWGDDFFAVVPTDGQSDLPGGLVQRLVSMSTGDFELLLTPQQAFRLVGFDPETDLVAADRFTTGPAGTPLDVTASLAFTASIAPDGDFDGLPDDIEFAIGTSPTRADTDNDGLDDRAELEAGEDPVGGQPRVTGLVSSVDLRGEITDLVPIGDAILAAMDTGLALVDVSNPDAPAVLGRWDIESSVAAADFDPVSSVVAAAAGDRLLIFDPADLANNADPAAAIRVVSIPAVDVAVVDGVAYVTGRSFVRSVDTASGELLQSQFLGSDTFARLTRQAGRIVTLQNDGDFRGFDVTDPTVIAEQFSGSVSSFGSFDAFNLFLDGDRLVAGLGDYREFDVSVPPDAQFVRSLNLPDRVAVADAGLLVALSDPGVTPRIELYDVTNPDTVPEPALLSIPIGADGLLVAGGLAYLRSGTSLSIVNYRSADLGNTPPTVSAELRNPDVDAGTEGLQVVEGSTLVITTTAADDNQVRRVEFIVDGQIVGADNVYPYDLSVSAGALEPSATSRRILVTTRATDSGGNVATSAPIEVDLVPDTFPPEITSFVPSDGATRFPFSRNIRLTFSEAIESVAAQTAVTLTAAGVDAVLGTADDFDVPLEVSIRGGDRIANFAHGELPEGMYRIALDRAAIRDQAGNQLGEGIEQRDFVVVPLEQSPAFLPFGTPISDIGRDDISIETTPLPFQFEFFGSPVSGAVRVTSNGVVEFDGNEVGSTFRNRALPYLSARAIFGNWDDHHPGVGGAIGLYEAEGVRAYTWQALPHFGNRSRFATFQIAILASGVIQVRYGSIELGDGSATIGLSNSGNSAVVPSLGSIEGMPDLGVTDSDGFLDNDGLALLNSSDEFPSMLVFVPVGDGGYTVAFIASDQ